MSLPLSPTVRGILYMTAAMLCFSVMNNCVRQATLEMHSTQVTLLRSVLMTGFMACWILYWHGNALFRTNRIKRHAFRAFLGILATEMWFYSLGEMPINEATALSFTSPVFATLFAILFLKERSTWPRWGAVLTGFAGTWVILRPDSDAFSEVAMMVLASAALLAMLAILIKTLTRTDHPDTIIFYQALLMTPLAVPFAMPYWQPVGAAGLGWVLAVTLSSIAAHLFLVRAYALAEMTLLMPLDFTRLIFTATLAWFWFGEVLDSWTVLGAFIIIAGSVWGAAEGNEDVRRRLKRLLSLQRQ